MNNIIKLYEDAINNNNYKAMYLLGDKYYSGYKIEQDYDLAMFYFRMAARFNYGRAEFNIGKMYEDGLGIIKNYEKAIEWYKLASTHGEVKALASMGDVYLDKNEFNKAFELYNMAYENYEDKNDAAVVMLKIGYLYIYGRGVDKNRAKGLEWLKMALKTGNKSVIKIIGEEFNIDIF